MIKIQTLKNVEALSRRFGMVLIDGLVLTEPRVNFSFHGYLKKPHTITNC